MNTLAIGAVSGIIVACYLVVAMFVLRSLSVKLHGTPAGEGLAALVL